MRAERQRWFWLMIVWPAGGVFAAEAEHGLPQSALNIKQCSDEEVATFNASLTRAVAQLRVKRRQRK